MARRSKGFGYAINYDRAIAEDEAAIALWTKFIEAKLFAEKPGDAVLDVIVCRGGWERLGLTRQDALDLRDEFEYAESDFPGDNLATDKESYANANRVFDTVIGPLVGTRWDPAPTEAAAKAALKRAKASLSRHRRNKEKYGN